MSVVIKTTIESPSNISQYTQYTHIICPKVSMSKQNHKTFYGIHYVFGNNLLDDQMKINGPRTILFNLTYIHDYYEHTNRYPSGLNYFLMPSLIGSIFHPNSTIRRKNFLEMQKIKFSKSN